MKHYTKANLLSLCLFLFLTYSNTKAQVSAYQKNISSLYIGLKITASDSLQDFDEAYYKTQASGKGLFGSEFHVFLYQRMREFINLKYNLITPISPGAPVEARGSQSSGAILNAPCSNEDFELNSFSGWAVTSGTNTNTCAYNSCPTIGSPEAWIRTTPFADPNFNPLSNSPLGGSKVAQLNDSIPGDGKITRISQTFSVTSANALFQYAYAAVFNSPHPCCEQPFLNIYVKNCSGTVLSCPQVSVVAPGASCASSAPGFTTVKNRSVCNWQVKAIDLTTFIGSCVTIEVTVGDCSLWGHAGYVFFDAHCGPMNLIVNGVVFPASINAPTVTACGASTSTITAPSGMGPYNWNGPAGSGIVNNTNQTIVTSVSGSYSLSMNPTGACASITKTVNLILSPGSPAGFTSSNICNVFTFSNAGAPAPATQTFSFAGPSPPGSFTTQANSSAVVFPTPGTYTVTQIVTNTLGCTGSVQAVIVVPLPLTSTTSIISNYNGQNISCFGLSDGSASVTAGGGNGPYTYSWTSVPSQTNAVAGGLDAGTYSIIIKDVNNCTITNTISLTQPPPLTSTANITSNYNGQNISCFGLNNGSASVTVSGGTGPYTYSWTSAPSQSTSAAVNLSAGIYTAIVHDVNNCSVTETVSLTQPPILTATAVVTSNYNGQSISCFGLSNGSAQVNASGGTGSYTYSWASVPSQTTASVINLGAGTYSVTVSDINNCSSTQVVTITQPSQLTSSAVATSNYNGQNVSCYGYSDGSASVIANGGTSPYSYSWSTSPTQTTSSAVNIGAGTYSITVTDNNGCTITSTVQLSQPSAATSTITVSNYNGQQISCFGGSNGSATVSANNGTGPFTYTWSTVPAQTGTLATNLSAGTYSIFITDANGCVLTDSVLINNPAPVSLTAAVTSNYNGQNISCFGLSNGSASVSAMGGTAPYSYSWTSVPTQTTSGVANLGAGSYSVIVTDINGCVMSGTVLIAQPAALNTSLVSLSDFNGYNVTCFGSTNGNANISATGGTGSYTYLWSNNAVAQNLSNIGAGNYSVVVTDVNGCADTLSLSITQPPKLTASIDSLSNYNGFNVKCHGSINGSVFVSVHGGVSNYSYAWNNGNTNQNLAGVGYGNYSVTVVDQNSCSIVLDTALTEPPPLLFNSSIVQPDCNGFNNGAINVSAGGGVNPIAYQWSNGAVTQNLTGITSGTYQVVYMDKNNCGDSASIVVNQPQALTLTRNIFGIKCYGDTLGGVDIFVNGGIAPYNYIWSNGSTNQNLHDLRKGVYSLLVTDQKGCLIKDTIILSQPDSLIISLFSPVHFDGHNISYPHGNDGSVQLTVNGGAGPYSYLWSDNEAIKNISNLFAGTYNVTVTDNNGCRVAGSITLTEPNVLEMPSGFSPNNDGKNDLFVIHGIEAYPDNQLSIYNRWGNIVYEKIGYNNEWNGVSDNGHTLPDATYFVILEIKNGQKILKGFVELRRESK